MRLSISFKNHPSIDKGSIKALFQGYKSLGTVRLFRYKHLGLAFADLEKAEAEKAAKELQGKLLAGKPIGVYIIQETAISSQQANKELAQEQVPVVSGTHLQFFDEYLF